MTDLTSLVQQLEAESGGEISFAFRNLQTGETLGHFPDRKVKTASLIKLPILVYIALAVEEKSLTWDTPLTLTEAEKVGGAGVLSGMTPGIALPLRDICYLMTVISDNTATNMIIEFVGRDVINSRMRGFGLVETTLFRKSYSEDTPESKEYGLGVTTAGEMVSLLTQIAQNEIGSPSAQAEILRMLGNQMHRETIPRYLSADWKYAGKTGAIDPLRNDVGIVTSPDGLRFALALMCQKMPLIQWTPDNPGMLALAKLSKHLLLDL